MTQEEMRKLGQGDVIRHKHGGEALVVHSNHGRFVIAVRTQHVSNPSEWEIVLKANQTPVE